MLLSFFDFIAEDWQQIMAEPLLALPVIGNLILIESLLSVDNAAVLATMVMDLEEKDRSKALKIGLVMAYIFRGLCLVFAAWLIKFWILKVLGGGYLLYLAYRHFTKGDPKPDHIIELEKKSWFHRSTVGLLGPFWATVVSVEVMDLVFSLDNVFAAVAISENLIMVWTGVFIGILAMRFVAQGFVKLMQHYPFLEDSAFLVIAILGLKLMSSVIEHFYPESAATKFLKSHYVEWGLTILNICIFVGPILTSRFFNVPKHHFEDEQEAGTGSRS